MGRQSQHPWLLRESAAICLRDDFGYVKSFLNLCTVEYGVEHLFLLMVKPPSRLRHKVLKRYDTLQFGLRDFGEPRTSASRY
jgi:hypothetical protein